VIGSCSSPNTAATSLEISCGRLAGVKPKGPTAVAPEQVVTPKSGVLMQGLTSRSRRSLKRVLWVLRRYWAPAAQLTGLPASSIGVLPSSTASTTKVVAVRLAAPSWKNQAVTSGLLATIGLKPGLVTPVVGLLAIELEKGL
jgi:hypothetical protein